MSSQQYEYDVFLSFWREDTRNGFTGHLCKALDDKGIHTFMDNLIPGKGEELVPSRLKAIEHSRTAIIVFSRNYASSSWCLDELSCILECRKVKGKLVLPVFYDIDPSDVRYQRGPYGEAFAKLEEKFKDDMDRVYKWRTALKEVFSIAGWDSRNQPEYQVIEDIVNAVSARLGGIPLHNIGYVVGMDSQIQEVLPLLELESDGALMMGIYGAAGIGKTTLARAIYNAIANQFEASCFLPQVRENSSMYGLEHLQNMLLSEMIGERGKLANVDIGTLRIKNRLQRKKILLILDDVDTLEQLEALAGKLDWFGPGSRVIITTQDKHLLAFHEVETTYEVQPLNPKDALELLSHQVFKQGDVDSSYTGILNEFVSYASGLPLALKVIGSRLFGTSVEEWTTALHRLKRIPPNEIQKTLKTSFDNLREEEEAIEWDGEAFKKIKTLIIRKGHPSGEHPSDFNPNQIKGIKSPKLVELTEASPSGSQVLHTSPNVPQTLPSQISHTLPNVPQTLPIQIPHTSPSVPRTSPSQVPPNNSQIVPLAPQNSRIARLQGRAGDPRDPEPVPPTQNSSIDFRSNIWRIVGLLSSVVGMPCFAFSPSFIRLIRGWNAWKFIIYYVFSLGVVVAFLFIKQSSPPKGLVGRVWYKIQGFLVLMLISVYTFYYDKAVDGKPEIRILVSNAAFVLMSLSYSKLRKLAYEMGVFSFFLSCLTVQLWTINWKLIWIPICFGFPLFFLHSSSDPV